MLKAMTNWYRLSNHAYTPHNKWHSDVVRKVIIRVGSAEKGINGGPGRSTAYVHVGCQRLASLMTKIDWINFERHVLCDDP